MCCDYTKNLNSAHRLTFDEAETDDGPREQQTQGDVPLDLPDVAGLGQGVGHGLGPGRRPVVHGLGLVLSQRLVDPQHDLVEVLLGGKLAAVLLEVSGIPTTARVLVASLKAGVQISRNVSVKSPLAAAFCPRHLRGERCKDVVQTVSEDDVVVDGDDDGDDALADADTVSKGTQVPQFDWTPLGELAQCKLQVVHWLANDEQDHEVRDQEGASSVLVS